MSITHLENIVDFEGWRQVSMFGVIAVGHGIIALPSLSEHLILPSNHVHQKISPLPTHCRSLSENANALFKFFSTKKVKQKKSGAICLSFAQAFLRFQKGFPERQDKQGGSAKGE